jgi:hypothetical protein
MNRWVHQKQQQQQQQQPELWFTTRFRLVWHRMGFSGPS